MSVRSLVLAVVVTVSGALAGAVPAGAEAPMTCLPEVAGAQFDDTAPFAGRLRPFAASTRDPTVVSRELACPYIAPDGATLTVTLAWDERPAGRFTCEAVELTITDADPVRARVDHPSRQAAALLEAPDRASVRAMGDAARLMLATVPASAADCSASVGSAAASTPLWSWAVVAAVAAMAVAGIVAMRRRRGRDAATVRADPVPEEAASLVGSQSPTAVGLVSALSDDPAGLDVMAAATVAAHLRGRPDLARVAMAARRKSRDGREPDPDGARRAVMARVLEIDGHPADRSTQARRTTRAHHPTGDEGADHDDR